MSRRPWSWDDLVPVAEAGLGATMQQLRRLYPMLPIVYQPNPRGGRPVPCLRMDHLSEARDVLDSRGYGRLKAVRRAPWDVGVEPMTRDELKSIIDGGYRVRDMTEYILRLEEAVLKGG